MSAPISFSGIVKSFEEEHVLKGVDLDVAAGESLVLVGPSASGKTVLLKMLMGLIPPDEGVIQVGGIDIAGLNEAERVEALPSMGMLFQRAALFDSMTVWENITFRIRRDQTMAKPEAIDLAVRKLSAVGLDEDVAHLYPVELSGGMQKRVGFARAIADDPEIFVLDEPTAGLDPIMTNAINRLILENAEAIGATVISITSDMDGARQIGERIAMLFEGKIIWQGPGRDAESCGNPHVEQFINRRAEGPIQMVLD